MSAEQQRLRKTHREAVILAETKKVLGFPVADFSTSPVEPRDHAPSAVAALTTPEVVVATRQLYETYGVSMAATNAYLLRYLRSKHLSIDDALAKLRRRRVFERTLPTISVTPTIVAALRSGALHLLGNDLERRPVLYVNVAAFTLPTLELDEAQRLLVILLEFMQAQCLLKNNEDDVASRQLQSGGGGGDNGAGATASPTNKSSTKANPTNGDSKNAATPQTFQEAEKESTRYVQQFTLLVNEEGAAWGTHESFLKNSNTFFSMFPKYYPLMLGAVLVLGASFEVRTAIQACVGSSPDDVRDAVRMINRQDLTRYMPPCTIPVELGGQKQVAGSAMNFSEAVLRHWFTLTSQMEEESAYGPSSASSVNGNMGTANGKRLGLDGDENFERRGQYQRPLYVPPPPLGTTQQLIARQRQMIELQHLSVLQDGSLIPPAAANGTRNNKNTDSSRNNRLTESAKRKASRLESATGRSLSKVSQRTSWDSNPSPLDVHDAAGAASSTAGNEPTDDGVCSMLSGADEEDDNEGDLEEMASDNEDEGDVKFHSLTSTVGARTAQFHTAASSSPDGGSLVAPNRINDSSMLATAFNAPAGVSAEENAKFVGHPEAAMAALREERQRRWRAEQALQFRDLGVTLDLRNASVIEWELAGLHQDLNVLVAEVLVKAEAAGKRQKASPTLNQLLDLTLTAFDVATRTPSTVPAMSLAEPAQREAVSTSCCSFM